MTNLYIASEIADEGGIRKVPASGFRTLQAAKDSFRTSLEWVAEMGNEEPPGRWLSKCGRWLIFEVFVR